MVCTLVLSPLRVTQTVVVLHEFEGLEIFGQKNRKASWSGFLGLFLLLIEFPTMSAKLLSLPLLLGAPSSLLASADSVVVFNEVHYHPTEQASDTEWLELRNLMGVDVDISGWKLDRGVSYQFAEGTVVPGHGLLIVASDPSVSSLSGRNALGPFVGGLSNGGELLRLVNNSGRVMDSFTYEDGGDWPSGADGSGVTLAKRDESSANSSARNWVASPQIGGTPGQSNFADSNQQPTTTELISLTGDWRYREEGAAPPGNWKERAYDDSLWPEAGAGFFAGDAFNAGVDAGLLGYWPLDEASGSSAPNLVSGGVTAQLFNGVTWLNDPQRGQVLSFDGNDDYGDAGMIPQLGVDDDFTWSFWSYDAPGGIGGNVMLGNRKASSGADFNPREFIKFTTDRFQWHESGSPVGDVDYAPIAEETWIHHALVKEGASLTYYRNGLLGGSSFAGSGLNNAQPFYWGGDRTLENWGGRLDEISIWESALPASSVAGLANESLTPFTAPTSSSGDGLVTELGTNTTTYYFRREFNYSGNPDRTNLILRLQVDDGAVVYLNGSEVHRENMPMGAITHQSFALSDIQNSSLSQGIVIPADNLLQGSNVLAVSSHQSGPSSSDMIFRTSLVASELPPSPQDLEGELVFSEIQAADASSFQIELLNTGSELLDLNGYEVRSSGGASYTFPASDLPPAARLAISSSTLGFTPLDNERLFLFRPGQSQLLDARVVTGRLRGLDEDGRWSYPSAASFGTQNVFVVNQDVVINEIMYHPRPLRQAASRTESTLLDWDAVWRFNDSGNDVGDAWELVEHAVGGGWSSGAGPLGFEDEPLPIPIVTSTTAPIGRAIFFETNFTLTASELEGFNQVEMSHLIDDGAVFYINGFEIERHRMNPEPTNYLSTALGGGEAVLIQGVSIPKSVLKVGSNRVSVQVHQTSLGSSDIVFGLQLQTVLEVPAAVESGTQWIELFNKGAQTVDLSHWEFSDGVAFTFPPGTELESGGYLVVARDAVNLSADYPGITILGNWEGNLSRSGERLALRDSSRNLVDEVSYYDDGSWPAEADGEGSSIELRDARADNENATSWQASDEGARSVWQNYSYRASGANQGNDPSVFHEFIFGLLDNGELLIDDISVIEDPDGVARELIQNGDFSSGDSQFWRLIGTHRYGEVIDDPLSSGNKVLHLKTSGSTEHLHNQASTTLKAGSSFITTQGNLDYEISFRAKWLSGSNQFHSRLYFNRAARTTFLSVPDGGGTPGGANSRVIPNIGPSLGALAHFPAVPVTGQPCLVSVQGADADGIQRLSLFYSVDGGAFQMTGMVEQAEGQWTAFVPGQNAASKVQFYVEAEDQLGAISLFPPNGPDSRAVIPFDDGEANLDYGDCEPNNFRIVMTDEDRDVLHNFTNAMSNDRLGCTVIWNESEIYYGCRVRLKGSQRGRPQDVRIGFNVRFPADNLFLGAHETIAIDRSGGTQFSQQEILVKHTINHAGGGIPGMNDDLIRIIAPKSQHTGSAMLLKSRYDSEFLDNMYQDGGDGTAWEYELIYYPTTTVGGDREAAKLPNPDRVKGVGFASLGTQPELYRWHWLIKNNRDEDNYTPLVEMVTQYGQPASAQYLAKMDQLIDVDQFLRAFAVQSLCGLNDNYSTGAQHNAIFYQRPEDGRFLYFPWDMDWSFVRGATSSLTPNGDLQKLLTSEANRRAFYGHIHDICHSTFNSSYLSPWANHYDCFLTGSQNLSGFLSYINQRSSYALSQVSSEIPPVDFALTTPNAATSQSALTLEGSGWVNVREIRLVGAASPLAVVWTDSNTFQVQVPVIPGTNTYTLEGYDFDGQLLGSDSIEITGQGSVIPATLGNLVISELMFNPEAPAGEDGDDYEFIELFNTSTTASLDLEGVRFSDGIDFTFPASTLGPGERIVVPRKLAFYQSRYGSNSLLAGEYAAADGSNMFSNGGEAVELVDALGNLIQSFTYDDSLPWPESSDGEGFSLELINPTLAITDDGEALRWRSSRTKNGNPGTEDSESLADWADELGITDYEADPDGDGQANIIEFFFGTNPLISDQPLVRCRNEGDWFVMEVSVRNGADGLVFKGKESLDLSSWMDATYLGRLNNLDEETSTVSFGREGFLDTRSGFLRLEVEAAE